MSPRCALVLALLPLALACRTEAAGVADTKGSFTASWIGADTGKLSARPRAAFCTEGNRLELSAVEGDAGVGLAIYPVAELRTGLYDGFDPGVDTIRRPGVVAAARWFTEQDLEAYQSAAGSLQLRVKGTTLAGSFALQLRKVHADDDSILLTGRFSGVIPGACPADSVSPSAPAQ